MNLLHRAHLVGVAAAAIALLAAATPAAATDRYVDDSPGFGADNGECSAPQPSSSANHACTTIAYTVAHSLAGDTVHVGGGTYMETVVIPASISLVEDQGFARPATSGDAIVDGGTFPGITVTAGAGGTVSGLTIRGGTGPTPSMQTAAPTADVTIAGNRFDDPTDSVGVYLGVSTNGGARVIGNQFVGDDDGAFRIALKVSGSGSPEIADNSFTTFVDAIHAFGNASPGLSLRIHDNWITGIYTGPQSVVGTGVSLQGTSATITRNVIEAVPAAPYTMGVSYSPGSTPSDTQLVIERNVIRVAFGLFLADDGPVTLASDLIVGRKYGIETHGVTEGIVADGVTVTGSSVRALFLDSSKIALDSTIVGPTGIATPNGGTCTIAFSNIEPGGTAPADGSCGSSAFQSSVAPGYANPAAGDYHLAANSPLVDRGSPAAPAGDAVDLDGDPRALDGDDDGVSRRDIGADEWVPPASPPTAPPTSGGGAATDTVAPVVERFSLSRRRFRVGRGRTPVAATRTGTTIRYRLSEAAAVTIRIERRVHHRWSRAGSLRRKGARGANRLMFSGRVGRRALRCGRYRARIVAVDGAGNQSAPKLLGFRVVR